MYATVQDVADELGQEAPVGVEARQWERWLSRVHSIILARIPDLDNRLASGLLSPMVVGDIQAAVVARMVQNPRGLSQLTVNIDDGVLTEREGSLDGYGLNLTDREWAMILPSLPQVIGSMRLYRDRRGRGPTW